MYGFMENMVGFSRYSGTLQSMEIALGYYQYHYIFRSSHPEAFLEKGVLKICSKSTAEHPYRSVISIKLLCHFIKITFRDGCFPVNLLHIFGTRFTKNTSGQLLLYILFLLFVFI